MNFYPFKRQKRFSIGQLIAICTSSLFVLPIIAETSNSKSTKDARWFDIEVIVFKNARGNTNEELWPKSSEIVYPEKLIDQMVSALYPAPEGEVLTPPDALKKSDENDASSTTKEVASLAADAQGQKDLVPFSPLLENELALTSIKESLQRSSQYQPLVHYGWRQPVYDRDESEWVRVVGGLNYNARFDHQGRSLSENSSLKQLGLSQPSIIQSEADQGLTSHFDTPTLKKFTPVPEIDGAIQVYLSRYLHVNTKLFMRIPGEEELDVSAISSSLSSSMLDLTKDGQLDEEYETNFNWSFQSDNWMNQEKQTTVIERLLNYPLAQSRRVRSGETHYFDHPLFGVIIQIRPYSTNKEES